MSAIQNLNIHTIHPGLSLIIFYVSDIHPISNSEYDKLLLEGALQDPIKTNPLLDHSSTESDVGTRSVLDALKEISRKRIHSSEVSNDVFFFMGVVTKCF